MQAENYERLHAHPERSQTHLLQYETARPSFASTIGTRFLTLHFHLEATYQKETEKVQLRGKFIQGRQGDLPTMIWLSDILEPSENFTAFFTRPDNKVLDNRNVWLLNYRNMGDSDHHDSFGLEVSSPPL